MVRLVYFSALTSIFAAVAIARHCQNITVPVTISARNGIFSLAPPADNIQTTNFVLNSLRPGVNFTAQVLKDYKTVSGRYNIAATYCTPDAKPSKVVQVLTHGVGFDRTYWDLSFNNYNYSYVDQALARGYSTFTYDRLGLGQSSRGDPINEVQSFLELSLLDYLTTLLRDAKVPSIRTKFDKVVHVGHSFGSILCYALAASYPGASDGIALTGFSLDTDFIPAFIYSGNLVSANSLPGLKSYADGYLAFGDPSSLQTGYLGPNQFDPKILLAITSARQPATIGELLTLGAVISVPNTFEGPVLVVTGDRDMAFCGGNCSATVPSIPAKVQGVFTNATAFNALVVPGAGHGLNLEYTHPVTYEAILQFFDSKV